MYFTASFTAWAILSFTMITGSLRLVITMMLSTIFPHTLNKHLFLLISLYITIVKFYAKIPQDWQYIDQLCYKWTDLQNEEAVTLSHKARFFRVGMIPIEYL